MLNAPRDRVVATREVSHRARVSKLMDQRVTTLVARSHSTPTGPRSRRPSRPITKLRTTIATQIANDPSCLWV